MVQETSNSISGFGTALAWSNATLDGAPATIHVETAGAHRFTLWMREDGFIADKVLLTLDNSYTPTGSGPAASTWVRACSSGPWKVRKL